MGPGVLTTAIWYHWPAVITPAAVRAPLPPANSADTDPGPFSPSVMPAAPNVVYTSPNPATPRSELTSSALTHKASVNAALPLMPELALELM